jgi:hypothetical protein
VMRSIFLSMAVITFAVAAPQQSEAAFKLKIESSTGAAPLFEQTFVDSFNLSNFNVGDFRIGNVTGLTNEPGTDTGLLSLSYRAFRNGGSAASILTISLTSTAYTGPGPGVVLSGDFDVATVGAGGTVFQRATIAAPGVEFSPAIPGQTITQDSPVTGLLNFPAGYSLTTVATIQLNGTGNANRVSGLLDATVAIGTPAPAAAFMALSALPLIGVALRRRRKDSTEALAV